MAADGSTLSTPPAAQHVAPPGTPKDAAPAAKDGVEPRSTDTVAVADPGALADGIVRQDEVPLTQFPNGMRRTVRMVYDVSHGQHHPFEYLTTDDVRTASVETPHAVNTAYAYMASSGALNDLVTVVDPHAAARAREALASDGTAPTQIATPLDDVPHQGVTEQNALRHLHRAGLVGQQNTQSMCGEGVGYPSKGFRRCAVNVCRSVEEAVKSVVLGDVDGALALTRPVGSSVAHDSAATCLHSPSAYAACNAVTHAVRTAWDAGAKRVGIVSLQTWYPAGLAEFVRGAPDGSAFLTSIHASAKNGTLSREAQYGPAKDSKDGVLNMQVFSRGGGADAMVHAARNIVLPAMTAYSPDVLLVVCGEQNPLFTYPVDLRCDTLQTTWAVVVQELMAACPGIVVLTDALLRPNRCAAALTHVMYALQGRAFQHNLGDGNSGIRGTVVGKTDVDMGAAAYVEGTAAGGPFAAVKAALQ